MAVSFFQQFLVGAEKFFEGFFKQILGSQEAKTLEQAVLDFVKTDVGKLALDAVNIASAMPITGNDQIRAAAVAQLRTDLGKAGKDASTLATSTLNLFIELAFTYVTGSLPGLVAIKAEAGK